MTQFRWVRVVMSDVFSVSLIMHANVDWHGVDYN